MPQIEPLEDFFGSVEELIARQAITQRITDYCRAVDRGDEALLASVFWPGATIVHPPFEGSAEDFCKAALDFIKLVEISMHTISNVTIEFDGQMAYTEAYFTGYHRLSPGPATSGLIADVLLPHHEKGKTEDHFVGGRYLKWFERRGGDWRVAHHIGFREWERWEDAADRYPIPEMGRRDRSDPSYLRRT